MNVNRSEQIEKKEVAMTTHENGLKHGNKPFVVLKPRMLDFLMNKGFEPSMTRRDYKNPKHYVWQFENSPSLEVAIEEYFAICREQRNG